MTDRLRLSVLVRAAPVRGIGSEFATCVGVDIQSSAGAPGDELLRVECHPVNPIPLAAALAFEQFRAALPLVERRGEKLSIHHDFKNPGIISAALPKNTDTGDIVRDATGHADSPSEPSL